MPSKKKRFNSRFPPARIKKIMQTDEDVGKVATPVPVIISRSLELFIESLIMKTNVITQQRNAKTLSASHIKHTILSEKTFDFLKDLVASVPDITNDEEQQQQQVSHLMPSQNSHSAGQSSLPSTGQSSLPSTGQSSLLHRSQSTSYHGSPSQPQGMQFGDSQTVMSPGGHSQLDRVDMMRSISCDTKPRGRPRTKPVSNQDGPKRGRGRPRKERKPSADNAYEDTGSDIESNNIQTMSQHQIKPENYHQTEPLNLSVTKQEQSLASHTMTSHMTGSPTVPHSSPTIPQAHIPHMFPSPGQPVTSPFSPVGYPSFSASTSLPPSGHLFTTKSATMQEDDDYDV